MLLAVTENEKSAPLMHAPPKSLLTTKKENSCPHQMFDTQLGLSGLDCHWYVLKSLIFEILPEKKPFFTEILVKTALSATAEPGWYPQKP